MTLRARLSSCALVCALFVPAFAGNGDPPSSANKGTEWVKPYQAAATAGECQWKWTIPSPPLKDDQTDDPATQSTIFGSVFSDAYAHAIADGMQIWAYSWATDASSSTVAGAGTAAMSFGRGRLVATQVPAPCVAKIQGDWTPRFRMRVHVKKGLGSAGAGGIMLGSVPEIGLNVNASLDLSVNTDPTVVASSASYTVANVGGVSYTVQRVISVGKAPDERIAMSSMGASASVLTANVNYSGNTWVSVSADRVVNGETSEAESFLWSSTPGLELIGKCLQPCTGSVTIVY